MPLDDPTIIEPQEPVSMQQTVIRYGLIGGLLFIIIGLIGNMTGFSSPANLTNVFLNLLIVLILVAGLVVVSVRHHRDQELGGFITFGRAFLVGLLVVLIAGVISSIFTYIYVTVIDPDFIANMARDMQGMYESFGMSEDQIEEAMRQTEDMTPVGMVMQGIISQVIMGAIVSAIVALVMKKVPE